jgi:hypothetical protein
MNGPERDTTAVTAEVARGGPAECARGSSKRTLIFHYHLFKNAGTSVDELLRRNFGSRWVSQEFPGNRRENAAGVAAFICDTPHLQAISSHTALLPVPKISGVKIFPIIFIRHPIDRLRSAYEFERRQNANTAGARLAKIHDFAGYLRELLRNPRHRQIRNFQTFRLSHNEVPRYGSELQRAISTVEQLPFVGLVERFDEALKILSLCVRPLVPRFPTYALHRNWSAIRDNTLLNRLAAVQTALGPELYSEICVANADDLVIHQLVNDRFEKSITAPCEPPSRRVLAPDSVERRAEKT